MTKQQIIAEVAQSRAAIARDYASVRREMDFQAKLNQVIRRKPLAWLGGAAALGWLLSGPKTKTRVVTKFLKPDGKPARREEKATASRLGVLGVLIALVKFSLPLLRPLLTAYAGNRFADIASKLAR